MDDRFLQQLKKGVLEMLVLQLPGILMDFFLKSTMSLKDTLILMPSVVVDTKYSVIRFT